MSPLSMAAEEQNLAAMQLRAAFWNYLEIELSAADILRACYEARITLQVTDDPVLEAYAAAAIAEAKHGSAR